MARPESQPPYPDGREQVEGSPEWEHYSAALDHMERMANALTRKIEVVREDEKGTEIFVGDAARHTEEEKARKTESLLDLEVEVMELIRQVKAEKMPMLAEAAEALLQKIRTARHPHLH